MKRLIILISIVIPCIILGEGESDAENSLYLQGNISFGRKNNQEWDSINIFRNNRSTTGAELTVGVKEIPVYLNFSRNSASDGFIISDISIKESGVGIRPMYRFEKIAVYATIGQMAISIDNNHVGAISDEGKGYWMDTGAFYRPGSGDGFKLNYGFSVRYSTGTELRYIEEQYSNGQVSHEIISFDMGGLYWGLNIGFSN